MDKGQNDVLGELLLGQVPGDGAPVGNQSLKRSFLDAAAAAGHAVDDAAFETLRTALIDRGLLVRARGRGGSVRRGDPTAGGFSLQPRVNPATTAKPKKAASRKRAARRPSKASDQTEILSYRHIDKRRNNPPVGLVSESTDPDEAQARWCYDPHIDPALQFDFGRAAVEKLIDDALASGDQDNMRAALQELKRYSEPYLNWTGKAEGTTFEVDTVSLHVHERIDPASILAAVRKQLKHPSPAGGRGAGGEGNWKQPDLFAAPFENLPLRDAIDFYRHEKGWSNRLVAGDSLLVMNSLLQKEGMAGRVQMIYIDPPYGIKYGSNFQPFVNKRDVKDRKDEDLTQEPEMIKAFRDTWELGIHSYLTYLRDRLLLARELLAETGSVFVQISDENLHHLRELGDEIFGADNFVVSIVLKKKSATTPTDPVNDYVLWYAKSISQLKVNKLFSAKNTPDEDPKFNTLISEGGLHQRTKNLSRKQIDDRLENGWRWARVNYPLVSQDVSERSKDFIFRGRPFKCGDNRHWTFDPDADMHRLAKAGRIFDGGGESLGGVVYWDDWNFVTRSNLWDDTHGEPDVIYVVQTTYKAIERCLLMTTEPGDLVLDPTCGSGTTAFVAEKWGRRWITCDTSRVAVTLAKQRLMTASYDYYALHYPHEGLKGGFIYKTVPHITLKSIANNPEIDEIYGRMHPAIDVALAELNKALSPPPQPSPVEGEGAMKEWEVPFEFPDDWPEVARARFDAFHAARQAMQRRMDDSIAAHGDQETLYDQPQPDKSKLRISGPFSVEAVPYPSVLALDTPSPPTPLPPAGERSSRRTRPSRARGNRPGSTSGATNC